ncbi:MAG: flagellar filament capping protein FliD [Desulfobacterota bacterium]|nr:flagellar filament capping protein FliD [Thermodesulfobacteriota bacterium]
MAGTSFVSGLASGLDWRNIIDQLRRLENKKVDLINQKKKEYGEKVTAWQEINKKLLSLKTKAEELNSSQGFGLFKSILTSNSTTKPEEILSATAGEEASAGIYQIVVHQLARAQKYASQGFASQTSPLNFEGELLINGKSLVVSPTDSLLTIRNKINALNTGADPSKVTATLLHYGGQGYRLVLTSDLEGAAGMSLLNGASGNLMGALGLTEIQSGADAHLSVDGIALFVPSNAVRDVIPGVILNLKKAQADTTVTVKIERDHLAIKEKIKELVKAYNEVVEAIQTQFTYDAEKEKTGGPLFGDSGLRSIRAGLSQLILNPIPGAQEAFSTLGMIGINLDQQGKLKIDESKLQDHLETHFDDVRRLFAFQWTSTSSHLTYIHHSRETKPGTYSIRITGLNPVAGYFVEPGDAIGEGEYLKGISGDAKGLVVRYSGQTTGTIGTVTLSFGVAELLQRTLHQMTDSLGGLIAAKTRGLEETMARMDKDIAQMELRINRRMEELERQFITMETALSRLQSQTNWLASQIRNLNRNWQ